MRVTNLVYLASAVALGVQAFPAPAPVDVGMKEVRAEADEAWKFSTDPYNKRGEAGRGLDIQYGPIHPANAWTFSTRPPTEKRGQDDEAWTFSTDPRLRDFQMDPHREPKVPSYS